MLFLFLLLFENELAAQTQVYPVSVTTQITPPYSVNLADYAAPGCEQLKVIILQRDLTQQPYPLFLKMEISLNGRIIIRTSAQYIQTPLILDPGVPTVVSGSDLYPFFDPQNMEFPGYSRETYLRTKSLPEGSYTITFTAYDYLRREVALSRGGSMFCFLAKTEPPLLNLPINNTGIPSNPLVSIVFQWLPRSVPSLNSTFTTLYRLELFEMRLGGRSPDETVQSGRPLFTSETERTSLVYTIADPQLEEGMRYAWRVKATDTRGRDYIRNNGYSEVFSFVYGIDENVALATSSVNDFKAEALSPKKAKLSWDPSTEFDNYKVFYREENSNDDWFGEETVQSTFELSGLTSGKVYECRVQGKKNRIWGDFSNSDTVYMPLPATIVCGTSYIKPVITNINPLPTLLRLQEVDAGGFNMTVVDADGSNGRFSGRGYVRVSLFGNVKLRCEFSNILVNSDYEMVEGSIRLLTDNSEGGDNALWDIDEVFEGGRTNGVVTEGTEGVAIRLPDNAIQGSESIILDTLRQQLLIVSENGDTVSQDISGYLEQNVQTLSVSDSEGNLYNVDTETGRSERIGTTANNATPQQVALPANLNSDKGVVTFEPVTGETRYAFDKKDGKYSRSNLFTNEYKTIQMADGVYYDVPFKLIPAGESDVVYANINLRGNSLKEDSVIFRSSAGTIYNKQRSGNSNRFLLTLPSGTEGDGLEIFALYPSVNGQFDMLGKIIVLSYTLKRPKVILVPVNGNEIDEQLVKQELDNVYLPVGVDWQVSKDEPFEVEVGDLDVSGCGLFSQYTNGMKELNNAFINYKGESFDPTAVYLFVLRSSDDPNSTGDMPRGEQFGYIFTGAVQQLREQLRSQVLCRTIAHELGHGVFRLKHTFDNDYQITKSSTENLMDYTNGTALIKHQWDAIHDPGVVIGAFERDEDAASLLNSRFTILDSRHTLLFNLVFDNNNGNNLNYLGKIQTSRSLNPTVDALNLEYENSRENVWINTWKLRTKTSDEIINSVFKKIQNAEKDEKIETLNLNENGIYIGKFTLKGVDYPVAVYSEKTTIDNITKVQVTEIADLDTDENKKHFKSEETFIKYLLLAFYEESNSEPVLMIQIEKFDISENQSTEEVWLEYLNIIGTKKIAPLPGDPLIEMKIVGTDDTNRNNKIGGTYGCKRYTTRPEKMNCDIWAQNISNFPEVPGKNKVHDGLDLLAEVGTPVYAMFDGIAIISYDEDLGNMVLIKSTSSEHKIQNESETIWTSYGHLNSTISAIDNQRVKQGQIIGFSGKTGITAQGLLEWNTHVHLTIYKGGTNKYNRINPIPFLNTKFDENGN